MLLTLTFAILYLRFKSTGRASVRSCQMMFHLTSIAGLTGCRHSVSEVFGAQSKEQQPEFIAMSGLPLLISVWILFCL